MDRLFILLIIIIIIWGLYQYQQKLERREDENNDNDNEYSEYNKEDNTEEISVDDISFNMSDIGSVQSIDTYSMELGSMTNGDSSLGEDSSVS